MTRISFEGGAEDFSVGGVFGGEEVEAVVLAKLALLDLIGEVGNWHALLTVGREEPKGEFAAVAVGNGDEEILAILPGEKGDFGDARQAFSHHQAVLRKGRAEAVEIDLLEEIQIG